MARAVAEAIAAKSVLVAEAGTGTGKTFAYLVPALLSGGKVIISTGTKTLQDQLFDRDIPTVRAALNVPGDRGAAQGPRQLRLPLPPRARAARRRGCPRATTCAISREIERFARTTPTGDKADCAAVPENAGDLVATPPPRARTASARSARTTTTAS